MRFCAAAGSSTGRTDASSPATATMMLSGGRPTAASTSRIAAASASARAAGPIATPSSGGASGAST
jgi:hypothetical protein